MKYVFFHSDRFKDGTLWIIIDSKKPNVAHLRSIGGEKTIHSHILLETCLAFAHAKIWISKVYKGKGEK